jgi:hypothetical protein
MDIDLAALPDDVATLQRMVRTLAGERTALSEAQAEIEPCAAHPRAPASGRCRAEAATRWHTTTCRKFRFEERVTHQPTSCDQDMRPSRRLHPRRACAAGRCQAPPTDAAGGYCSRGERPRA